MLTIKKLIVLVLLFSNLLYANVLLHDKKEYDNFLLKYHVEKIDNIQELKNINFENITQNKLALGYLKETIWLKIEIENKSDQEEYILQLNESFYEEVEIFSFDDAVEIKNDGFSVLIKNKQFNSAYPTFNLTIPINTKKDFFIKLKSKFAKFGKLSLYEKEYFINHKKTNSNILYDFIFGVLFIISIFTLFLIFNLKDKIYTYYLGYIVFYWIYLINQSGYLSYFDLGNFTYELQATSGLIATFLVYFSSRLLSIKRYLPKVDKLLIFLAIGIAFLTPFYIIYYSPWNIIVNNLYSVIFCILIVSSLYITIKKNSKIKYYVFVIVLYFVFVFIFTLMISGKLPYNYLTRYGYIYASVIEAVFFSLLLANRYNNLNNRTIKVHKTLSNERNKSKKLLKKEVEKQTKEITLKNNTLQTLLKEKDLLLKEVHHRVENNFQVVISMLWFESKKYTESKESYLELINRIKSMSTVHQYLYNAKNLSKIDIDTYLAQIVDSLKLVYSKNKLLINLSSEKIDVEFNDAMVLGFISNEVIVNSIKHHDKQSKCVIDIELKDCDEYIILSIKDNGKGFDLSTVKNGLGLNLIKDFTKKLHEAKSGYNFEDGTLFELVFFKK